MEKDSLVLPFTAPLSAEQLELFFSRGWKVAYVRYPMKESPWFVYSFIKEAATVNKQTRLDLLDG